MTVALDWDAWRTAYPTMTYAEQQEFHSAIYAAYPEQRHYDPAYTAKAIEDVLPTTVVELGGWDGELAQTMLEQYPTITQWLNVEICREAAQAGEGRHPNYFAPSFADWYWNLGPWHCDLFVASHTIEHLTALHLAKVIATTQANALYLDAPLHDAPIQWQGSTTSHILEYGWTQVTDLCKQHGYRLAWAENHETDESSGGWARACLYMRFSS